MSTSRTYMAASVPRFLRQTRLGYLPLSCIIGSRLLVGDGGSNLIFDIVMLPVQEFQRMRTNVGVQHVVEPSLKAGPSFNPVFVLADSKTFVVPEGVRDPEALAKNHFLNLFGLLTPELPQPQSLRHNQTEDNKKHSEFFRVAKSCTTQSGETG